jgi:hypothetical protein
MPKDVYRAFTAGRKRTVLFAMTIGLRPAIVITEPASSSKCSWGAPCPSSAGSAPAVMSHRLWWRMHSAVVSTPTHGETESSRDDKGHTLSFPFHSTALSAKAQARPNTVEYLN